MKQFVAVIAIVSSLIVTTPTAHAAITLPTPTCVPIFGGGSTCEQQAPIVVNKQVRDQATGKYVDSLSTPYTPGQQITFHIFVTNISGKDLSGISIQDIFPSYLTFAFGDGKFDTASQTFTASITSLPKDQSKVISVTGTVIAADKLPATPSPLCISNIATASQGGKTSTDASRFCIDQHIPPTPAGTSDTTRNSQGTTTKGGLPIYTQIPAKKTPATGPEDIGYVGLAVSAIGGLYLRSRKPKITP